MKNGDKVKVEYTGTLSDGSIFDSSEGREPLQFTIGNGEVISGFEDEVRKMKLNEEKTITIKTADAYGEKNSQLIVSIPKDKFPPEVEVGARLVLKSPEGQQVPAFVHEIKEDSIVLDFNHPLAGKDLTFRIKVVDIK